MFTWYTYNSRLTVFLVPAPISPSVIQILSKSLLPQPTSQLPTSKCISQPTSPQSSWHSPHSQLLVSTPFPFNNNRENPSFLSLLFIVFHSLPITFISRFCLIHSTTTNKLLILHLIDLGCDGAYCSCVRAPGANKNSCYNGHCSNAFPPGSTVPNC